MIHITNATIALKKRGPDFQDIYHDNNVGLGHRRLSVIDTSAAANQPMWDESKRYCIIFNGEIFNFKFLKEELLQDGVSFFSESDTEVLLKLYIKEKERCLNKINGFFAFCIYDKAEQSLFVARDRFGVKPLLYLLDEDKFLFASEMKSMLEYGIDRELDWNSLHTFFQLNYIPAPYTAFKQVRKLMAGHYMRVAKGTFDIQKYYSIPYKQEAIDTNISYDEAKIRFKSLLEQAVERRLVSDVPLGTFLSGGIDSSVVTGIASRHKPDLHTFSIGFKDEKFFDETAYAQLVAKKFGTSHTVFSLTNDDLFSHVDNILNYTDEPFADSSAINVYILSKETRKYSTVALSGDGADELLGGYNKHSALLRSLHPGWKENLLTSLSPLLSALPQSRNGKFSNKVRQAVRFANGMKQSLPDRYWSWAGYADERQSQSLFNQGTKEKIENEVCRARKQKSLAPISGSTTGINEILLTDMGLVLLNDMLTKVDLMSMANGLEVRNPFLDYELVNFCFSLPANFKINSSMRKRILQDAFKDMLPAELYNRPKKGFEVPMLKWLRREMKSLIQDDLLSEKLISEQGIFDYSEIKKLKTQLYSTNPGDVHARIWALVVFQSWWKSIFYNSK
jgi:asparagine synthase (glutamine-hydrolysing)